MTKMVKTVKSCKMAKTNEVVYDAIWIARNPEKKFWTAEVEIYPWVTSNGPSGYRKMAKKVIVFWLFRPLWHRHIADSPNFNVLVSRKALKAQISSSKMFFVEILLKNAFLTIFVFFQFVKILDFVFVIFALFKFRSKIWFFIHFSLFLFRLYYFFIIFVVFNNNKGN